MFIKKLLNKQLFRHISLHLVLVYRPNACWPVSWPHWPASQSARPITASDSVLVL